MDGPSSLVHVFSTGPFWKFAVTNVVVRPATSGDTPLLGRLGASLVALHHGFDPDRFIAASPNTELAYAAFLDGELKRPEVIMLVAEGPDGLPGYTYAAVEGTRTEHVHETARAADQRGLGFPAETPGDITTQHDRATLRSVAAA